MRWRSVLLVIGVLVSLFLVYRLYTVFTVIRGWAGVDKGFVVGLVSFLDRRPVPGHLIQEVMGYNDSLTRDIGSVILSIIRYTSVNLFYETDSYSPVPRGLSVMMWNDWWSPPWLTLKRGGGDCEDLSLLTYWLVRHIYKGSEPYRLFLVGVYNNETGDGHLFLVVKTPRGYYVVDPSGSFVNGYQLMLRIKVLLPNGTRETLLIDPMSVSVPIKDKLLSSHVADLVPVRETGSVNETSHVTVKPVTIKDAEEMIKEIILPRTIGATDGKTIVITDKVYRVFGSLTDALGYIDKTPI